MENNKSIASQSALLPTWLLWSYRCLWCLIMPFVLLRMWWRGRKVSGYRSHWRERFGFNTVSGSVDLWWHAVSVGELIASVPTLKAIRQQYPDLRILLTVTTPTGRQCAKDRLPEFELAYMPFDCWFGLSRVFARNQPKAIVIMETELWPELLSQAHKRHVPVVLANARMSEKSTRGYQRLSRMTRELLKSLNYIGAQSALDAERFNTLGAEADTVAVMGNLKFDFPEVTSTLEQGRALRTNWQRSVVWVAASTHAGEDELILKAHQRIREAFPQALLVLVPRHPDRFDQVARLIIAEGFSLARRSNEEQVTEATGVYLGDTMGELMLLMAASDAAFVGGSLVPHGGHNLLEPVQCHVPVLTGPHTHNFTHVHNLLETAGGVVTVANESVLGKEMVDLLRHSDRQQTLIAAANSVLASNRGAQARLVKHIGEVLQVA